MRKNVADTQKLVDVVLGRQSTCYLSTFIFTVKYKARSSAEEETGRGIEKSKILSVLQTTMVWVISSLLKSVDSL